MAKEQLSSTTVGHPNLEDRAAFSIDGCSKSCELWEECLMWKYDAAYGCYRDSGVVLGYGTELSDDLTASGWMIERIRSQMLGVPE